MSDPCSAAPWKVLLVDPDRNAHQVTALALHDFEHLGRGVKLLHAYTDAEAVAVLQSHTDIALVLTDVLDGESVTATPQYERMVRMLHDAVHQGLRRYREPRLIAA